MKNPDLRNRTQQWLFYAIAIYGATTLVSMATMSIGVAFVLLAMILRFAARREGPSAPRGAEALGGASLAIAVAGVLSLAAAEFWPLAYGGKSAEVLWARALAKLLYLFWPILLAAAVRELDARQRETALRVWLGAFGLLSAVACVQFFTGWPRPQPIPTLDGRFHATLFLGHHLSVASVLIFPLFLAIDRARRTREPAYIVASALGVAAVFLTYSRMAWVALPAALGLYVIWSLKPRNRAIACVALAVIGAALFFSPPVQERLGWKYGVWQRQELWRANWAFFKERPFTGAGMLGNQELSGYYLLDLRKVPEVFSGHAHNNVIDVLGSMGALGLIAWLFWWARAGQVFWRAPERKAWMCALLAYHINGLTQVNFWEGKVFHSLAWALAWAIVSASAVPSKGRAR